MLNKMCATHEQANPHAWLSHAAPANIQAFRLLASLELFVQLARCVCTISAARMREQRDVSPHIHGMPAEVHLKPCTVGLGNLTTRYTQLAVFPGIGKGCIAPGSAGGWGSLLPTPTWLLVLLKPAQLPEQRLKRWQAAAAEISNITA